MAQFTARRPLKPLFNADGMSSGLEPRDPIQCLIKLGTWDAHHPLQLHKRKRCNLSFLASPSLFSSFIQKPGPFCAEAASSVGDSVVFGDDGGDLEMDELSCFRGLVLDIAYRPVNVVCWKRAICLEFLEKADVLEYYDQTVNSPCGSFYIPAVLRVPHLLQVVKRRRVRNTLSRKNIFHRDNFTCQYCSSSENLTVDHVLPIARGGKWTWENLVTACAKCNSRKGQKTVEEANMKLIKIPKTPKDYDILAIPLTSTAIKMLRMRKGTPQEWHQYLSKPS